MATNQQNSSGQQGQVKDPEHDGRLKENREAGRTMGTTPASAARAEGHPQEHGSHGGGGSHASSGSGGGGSQTKSGGGEPSDLKSREYTDAQGNVHHHTHTTGQQGR